MKIWAECAAGLEKAWSVEMLETVPTSKAETAAFKRHEGYNDRCLTNSKLLMYGKELRHSTESARGEISRHLVWLDLRKNDRTPVKGAATAWLKDKLAAMPQGEGYSRPVLIAHQFALCMADEHWAATRAFVTAKENSKAEKAALAELSPNFAGCMTSGANLSLTVPILRLLLSEAAYHALTHQSETGLAR